MNHKFYSVNVSNPNNKKKVICPLAGFVLEKDIKGIYDNIFPKIFPKKNQNLFPY